MRFLLMVMTLALLAGPGAAAGRHADPVLEATLPQTLGGITLTIESQHGSELTTNSVAFDAFLKELGKSRNDFTLASAYAAGSLRAAVGCWRVKAAETSKLLPAFKAAVQASSATPLIFEEETLSGRSIIRIGNPGQLAQGPLYAFASGDALYFVQTPDPKLAEEAISKLSPL